MREPLQEAARPADGLSELNVTAQGAFWLATDPESGRRTLCHWYHGEARPLSPVDRDVGSRVNGYGGRAHACLDDGVIWVDRPSQALLYQPLDGRSPRPWWACPETRYGGLLADPQRRRLLAVEEQGDGRRGTQHLVAIGDGARTVMATGADFYGAPALSADGRRLAWVEWDLPHMPWQRSRLRIARLDVEGQCMHVATWDGGAAVAQPQFAPDGTLFVMSDHGGWWQPYRLAGETAQRMSDCPADHIPTPWQLGECHHLWPGESVLTGIVTRFREGAAHVLQFDAREQTSVALLPGATRVSGLAYAMGWLYAITQGPRHAARLERVHLRSGEVQCLAALETPVDVPEPDTIEVAVGDGERVSAFVYRPEAASERPAPLIVRVHGGPTSASYPVYDPLVRWWTHQGFAVADINPRGSGNRGRAFRERLAGEWGRLDVEDVIALAEALTVRGIADPERLFIRGQSAGGFTVLNVLASTSRFRAGASLYGVTDAPRLAELTHRFESGYLDWLLGDAETQRCRSPRYRAADIQAPVIFFQGEQDPVVVPEQTLIMAETLQARGLVAEVVLFEGEGHGIRHPQHRQCMIEKELAFYRAASASWKTHLE
ncbi:S9 family peptidase [Halomonas shantousis]